MTLQKSNIVSALHLKYEYLHKRLLKYEGVWVADSSDIYIGRNSVSDNDRNRSLLSRVLWPSFYLKIGQIHPERNRVHRIRPPSESDQILINKVLQDVSMQRRH